MENVYSSGHSPVSQIAQHILCILSSTGLIRDMNYFFAIEVPPSECAALLLAPKAEMLEPPLRRGPCGSHHVVLRQCGIPRRLIWGLIGLSRPDAASSFETTSDLWRHR